MSVSELKKYMYFILVWLKRCCFWYTHCTCIKIGVLIIDELKILKVRHERSAFTLTTMRKNENYEYNAFFKRILTIKSI